MGEGRASRGIPPVELRRKVFHVVLGALFMLLMMNAHWALVPAIIFFVIGLSLSLLHRRWRIPFISSILDRFDRDEDRLPGMGIITFFAGVLLVWSLFPEKIALAGCAAMTFGDPMASVIGMALGKHDLPWNRSKSIEGSAAFVLTVMIFTAPLYGLAQAAVISLAGAVFESIRYPKGSFISDNTLIPSGTALLLLAFGMIP